MAFRRSKFLLLVFLLSVATVPRLRSMLSRPSISSPPPAADSSSERIVFGAGCFWGVEATFRAVPGVISTRVGYSGGHTADPTYERVCAHGTGHVEVVEVDFNPAKVSLNQLLEVFWTSHDPTKPHRTGPEFGGQYRSAIFFTTPEQEAAIRHSIDQLSSTGRFVKAITTEIAAASAFHPAEEYHQQYYEKHALGKCRIP